MYVESFERDSNYTINVCLNMSKVLKVKKKVDTLDMLQHTYNLMVWLESSEAFQNFFWH